MRCGVFFLKRLQRLTLLLSKKSLPQVEVDPIWYFDITGGIPPLVLVNDNACLTPRSTDDYYNEVELVGL